MADAVEILLIDDNPRIGEVTTEYLERENPHFSVSFEQDPKEGLARIDAGDVDCVIADYDMPELDGLDLLKQVREDHPEIPVIIVTGHGNREVAAAAREAGASGYHQKGVDSYQYTELANKIETALAQDGR
ncbi:MAG: response regulator [Halobacteriales archaeon]|nr:response regulator [Halobacteriales archaeon]